MSHFFIILMTSAKLKQKKCEKREIEKINGNYFLKKCVNFAQKSKNFTQNDFQAFSYATHICLIFDLVILGGFSTAF